MILVGQYDSPFVRRVAIPADYAVPRGDCEPGAANDHA
jgi:hypothetical protein